MPRDLVVFLSDESLREGLATSVRDGINLINQTSYQQSIDYDCLANISVDSNIVQTLNSGEVDNVLLLMEEPGQLAIADGAVAYSAYLQILRLMRSGFDDLGNPN